MFDELSKESFPEREERILTFWKTHRIFEQSLLQRNTGPLFTIYDGPPFATGHPHYGHLLAGTIKDVIPRYKTMKGFHVPRRFGWDCHGLPVENEIEKAFNLSGAAAIEEFSIVRFNEECRKIVLRYDEDWQKTVTRMGRWVDFSRTFRTMDPTFMESVWWVFKQLYDKGLIYEGFRVMPFSAKLGTPLSNFEAGENYRDVDDPSITLAFRLKDEVDTALLVWTTTPWTLVSNLAAAVHPDITYVKIKDKQRQIHYILAKERLAAYYKQEEEYEIISSFTGQELAGKQYLPPFSYFSAHTEKGAFRVLTADFVNTGDGTGIVHCAPAFGEDDFYVCQRHKIDLVCPVDNNGRFTQEIPEYRGQFVKEADKDIIRRLKETGLLFHQTTLRHRYPFCPRSDTPLIYKAVTTWFVAVETFKDKLLRSNEQIHWVPEHLKHGRFGKWLEGARDWNIGRNRYWGTPIPLWRSEDGEIVVIDSIAELEALVGKKIDDLHRQHIDLLTFIKNGKLFRRIPEVFDCWFESGSMPYAQNHYPFENRELTEKTLPADFIAEGLDQTRGWFYTLTILAAALFDKPAFKNVIVNGILLAEDGAKMSKRLKNYPSPDKVITLYGADAIRLYMLHSPAVHADDLRFSERGVELVMRQILIPFWNAYSFLITYSRIYNWRPSKAIEPSSLPIIDRWMLSTLHKLIHDVDRGMEAYDLSEAVEPFVGFIDKLTNWYIRLNRRRFWEMGSHPDDEKAFATLYTVLLELTKIAAPFIPFLSEEIYQNLRDPSMPVSVQPVSVHLCDYPTYRADWRDEKLERQMAAIETAVSLGHSLRKTHMIKVRQPLKSVHIISGNPELLSFFTEQKHLIATELNVKEVSLSADEKAFVRLTAKPNFRVLGKKMGPLMKAAQVVIADFAQEQLQTLRSGKTVQISLEGQEFTLTSEDVQVERSVHKGMDAVNEGEITVLLDTTLNEELLMEGLVRELVNKVSTMRKEQDLDYTDRIILTLDTTDKAKAAINAHIDYVKNELLATEVRFITAPDTAKIGVHWDLNGESTFVHIQK